MNITIIDTQLNKDENVLKQVETFLFTPLKGLRGCFHQAPGFSY